MAKMKTCHCPKKYNKLNVFTSNGKIGLPVKIGDLSVIQNLLKTELSKAL